MSPTIFPDTTYVAVTSDNTLSDRVALAAIVVGGAAFIIAFLQMFYQYLSSDYRDKCSTGAIGGWKRYTRGRWNYGNWRMDITYPRIVLDCDKLLSQRVEEDVIRQRQLPHLMPLLALEGYAWFDVTFIKTGQYGFWTVWRNNAVLTRRRSDKKSDPESANRVEYDVVKAYQLPVLAMIEWFRYLLRHRRYKPERVRASWANIITCMGVGPTKALCADIQRADLIPSGLDAPLQTTTLANIGIICFILGMKLVKFDLDEGVIEARNKFAVLATRDHNLPGVGKIITLEGDIESLRHVVTQPNGPELFEVAAAANGLLSFNNFRATPYICDPYAILYALQHDWTPEHWRVFNVEQFSLQAVAPLGKGNLTWEANKFRDDPPPPARWTEYWQSLKIGSCPTILKLLAFMPYRSICSGFPLKAYLPFNAVFSTKCAEWWHTSGKQLCEVDATLFIEVSGLKGQGVPFLRGDQSYLLSSLGGLGVSSWLFDSSIVELEKWSHDRLNKITKFDQTGTFLKRFSILPRISRVLEGEGLSKVRDELEHSIMALNTDPLTVEAGFWFTLFCVDGRIRVLWDEIVRGRKEFELSEVSVTADDIVGYTVTPFVSGFLSLWLEICEKIDPFSHHTLVQEEFDTILGSWRGEEGPCVPKLPSTEATPDDLTKDDFYTWGIIAYRRPMMRALLPWLQLRSILMYYFLLCNEDSTDVAMAESKKILVQVA